MVASGSNFMRCSLPPLFGQWQDAFLLRANRMVLLISVTWQTLWRASAVLRSTQVQLTGACRLLFAGDTYRLLLTGDICAYKSQLTCDYRLRFAVDTWVVRMVFYVS